MTLGTSKLLGSLAAQLLCSGFGGMEEASLVTEAGGDDVGAVAAQTHWRHPEESPPKLHWIA